MDAMQVLKSGAGKWVTSILKEALHERYMALHYWGEGKR